jgi:hypothetical protein
MRSTFRAAVDQDDALVPEYPLDSSPPGVHPVLVDARGGVAGAGLKKAMGHRVHTLGMLVCSSQNVAISLRQVFS